MIANFFQLHENVEQFYLISRLSVTVDNVDMARQNTFVQLLLQSTHSNIQVDLFFR
jgi:hypothetical protein